MNRTLILIVTTAAVFASLFSFLRLGHTAAAQSVPVQPTGASQTTLSNDVCIGDNLLSNPSFEGEYEPYVMPAPGHPDCQTWDASQPNQYCERVKLATEWHPYWRRAPRSENWMNIQPEYVPSLPHETPPRVRSGEKSQHYFSFWSTHEAGMYQRVAALPGGAYCFSLYGHAWSSRTTLPDFTSDPGDHGFLHQRVGIDPTGGTEWQSPNIIWSDERMQYDEFGVFAVSAIAQADHVTVFAYSRADVPVKHNDVYWDDAVLTLDRSLIVDKEEVALMVDGDEPPVTVTRTVGISVTPGVTWTAVLDPSGTLTPSLTPTSGDDSTASLDVIIDTTGYPTGVYTSTLTISAAPGTANSPTAVRITLVVADDLFFVYLPTVLKP